MDKSKWEYKKLGEVASFINGYAFKPADWKVKGLPIIRIQNLTNPKAPYNYYDGNHIDNKYLVDNGDLLVSWSATLGAFIWNQGKALLNQHIFKTVFDKSNIDKHYLKYAIISTLNVMASKAHGITMRHITKKEFDNIKIPEPQLSEQQQIVSELDQLNELISLKQQQLKEYDALAQSIFYEMFGNSQIEKKRIDYCVSEMHIGPFGSALKNDCFVDKDASYCMVYEQQHAIKKTMSLPTRYVDKKKYEELKRFTVIPGDIIMSCRGTIGELYEIPQEAPMGIIHPSLMKIRIKRNIIDASYFLFFMRDFIKEQQSNGATIKMAITAKALSKELIPLPPLTLQQSFAERVRAIERQKALVKQSIAEVQTLLDSRMQEYFG